MAFNTGNPLGSSSPKDLSDNAHNLDIAMNGPDQSFTDRFGVSRYSIVRLHTMIATAVSEVDPTVTAAKSAVNNARDNGVQDIESIVADVSLHKDTAVSEMTQAVSDVTDGLGTRPFDTYALLSAYTPKYPSLAVVSKDPNRLLNGWYAYTGYNWTWLQDQPVSGDQLDAYVRNLFSERQTLGLQKGSTPVSGTAAGAQTFLIAAPAEYPGFISSARLWAKVDGVVSLKIYSGPVEGLTLKQSRTFSVSAGVNTLTLGALTGMQVEPGDRLAIEGNGVAVYSANTSFSLGYYSIAAGSITGPFTSSRPEISFTISAQKDAAGDSLTSKTRIGRPEGAVFAGTANTGPQTFVVDSRVAAGAKIKKLSLQAGAAGICYVSSYSKIGEVFTRRSELALTIGSGVNVFTEAALSALAIADGDYLGVTGNGLIRYLSSAGSADGGGTYFMAVESGQKSAQSSTSPAKSTATQLQVSFSMEAAPVTAEAFMSVQRGLSELQQAETSGGQLSLANAELIVIVGDSYSDGMSVLSGKAHVCNVSQMSEYNFANYSLSGRSAAVVANDIMTGVKRFNDYYDFAGLNAKYGLILLNTNDRVVLGLTEDQYFANIQTLINAIRGAGTEPIMGTEFGGQRATDYDQEQRSLKGLKAIADANGIMFIDLVTQPRITNNSIYLPFWKTGHPGTRTTYVFSDGILAGLKQLPRPMKGMKIFRSRGTVGSVASLAFRTTLERAALFKEISVGHRALSETEKFKYDSASGIEDGLQTLMDEYLKLRAGEALALGEYVLIEATLPLTQVQGLTLSLSDAAATVYARVMNASGVNWRALSKNTAGDWVVPTFECISVDRVTLLAFKSGGLTITTPILKWASGKAKQVFPRALPAPPAGAELLTETLAGTTAQVSAWGPSVTMVPFNPADSVLPKGATACIEIPAGENIKQTVTYTSSDDVREVVVRLYLRRWVPIFNPASAWDTAPINYSTDDLARVEVGLETSTAASNARFIEAVGLHWKCVEVRFTIPSQTTTQVLRIKAADKTIQFARASFRFASV